MNINLNSFWFLIFLAFSNCQIFDNGQNEIIKEYANSDQSLKLIVFKRLGNATAKRSVQVSLKNYDYKLRDSDKGNIFIADGIEKTGYPDDSLVLVDWKNNVTVEINYPAEIKIFKIEEKIKSQTGKTIEIKHNSRKKY